jgi:hypothetical protein
MEPTGRQFHTCVKLAPHCKKYFQNNSVEENLVSSLPPWPQHKYALVFRRGFFVGTGDLKIVFMSEQNV